MKKFISFILPFLIIIIIMVFFGCKKVEEMKIIESKYFEMPDKIIIYKNGERTSVEKDTELYNKIVYLTDKRLKRVRHFKVSGILASNEYIEENKNSLAIEFIYNKEMHTTYKVNDNPYEETYTSIFFPLADIGHRDNENMFFRFGVYLEYYDCPIGNLPQPNYLINLLNENF